MPTDRPQVLKGGDLIWRHALSTRLWHWLSAGMALVLLMSGLMIFNAHPRLYWGSYGANPDPAWLEIGSTEDRGYLRVAEYELTTTGLLGLTSGQNGPRTPIAFPGWATLPDYYDLATARRWHLSTAWYFALGTLVFGLWSVFNRHLSQDLTPRLGELAPRHLGHEFWSHIRLRRHCGAAACDYNVFQKLAYLGVTAGLIPAIILTGLTMSPWITAVAPWLLDLFGGRQSARSIHFIAAVLLVGFVGLHLIMVIIAGPLNQLRSMTTGWFRLPKERDR